MKTKPIRKRRPGGGRKPLPKGEKYKQLPTLSLKEKDIKKLGGMEKCRAIMAEALSINLEKFWLNIMLEKSHDLL